MIRKIKEALTRAHHAKEIKSETLSNNARKLSEFLAPESIRNRAEWIQKLLDFPKVIEFKDLDGDGRISHETDTQMNEKGVRERIIRVVGYGHMFESEFRATINRFLDNPQAPIKYPNSVRNNLSLKVISIHVEQLKTQCLRGALRAEKTFTDVDLCDPRWLHSAETIITEFIEERNSFAENRERFTQKHEESIRILIALCTTIAAAIAATKEQPENLMFMLSLMVFVQAMSTIIRMEKKPKLKKLDNLYHDYLNASLLVLAHENSDLPRRMNHLVTSSRKANITSNNLLRYMIDQAGQSINPTQKRTERYNHLPAAMGTPQAVYTLAGQETGQITTDIVGQDKQRTFIFENPGKPKLSLTSEEIIAAAQSAQLIKNTESFVVVMTHQAQHEKFFISLIYQDFEAMITSAMSEMHSVKNFIFERSKSHTTSTDFNNLQRILESLKKGNSVHMSVSEYKTTQVVMAHLGKFLSILLANGTLYPILMQDLSFLEMIPWMAAQNFGAFHSANYSPPKVEDRYPVLPASLQSRIMTTLLIHNPQSNIAERKKRLVHST